MAELKDFYNTTLFHGTSSSNDLTPSNIAPLNRARGRTPVPGFYGALDKGFANQYVSDVNILGDEIKPLNGGRVYSFETNFDSPLRVKNMYEEAPQEFIDSIRGTFPEQGRVMADSPPMQRLNDRLHGDSFNFREKFDKTLSEVTDLNKTTGKATYNDVYQSISRMHDRYPHLSPEQYEGMGVNKRAMGSVEFRRSGIDALFWDEGEGTLALLDPSDSVTYIDGTKVGRLNIKNMSEVTTGSSSAVSQVGPTTVFNAKGEVFPYANMSTNELTQYRDLIKSEIAAGNVDPKEIKYLQDMVLPEIENSIANPPTSTFTHAAPVNKPRTPGSIPKNQATRPVQSSGLNVGTPTNSSTNVASRTNIPKKSIPTPPQAAPVTPPRTIASGAQGGSARVVTNTGAIPHHSPAGAKIADDLLEETISSGAPSKASSKLFSAARDASEKVAKGGNLKLVGLGALVGLGVIGISGARSRTNQDNINRRLEMQRNGLYR